MKFPIDEQKFIDRWLSALNDPDEGDREQAEATVQTINRAYYAGLEAGHRSCDVTNEADGEVVPVQPEEWGGSGMKLKDVTVKRIAPGELPSILCFQLNYKYHTELGKFVVMFDGKQQILYVNRNVPEDDVQKFIDIVSYPSPYINNPDCPISDVMDHVSTAYGWKVYEILMSAYSDRQKKIREALARKKSEGIVPVIQEYIRSVIDDKAPDVFDDMLVSCIWDAGRNVELQTAYNQTSYSTKYVFYLGYLMGAGKIKV